jgi:hypothetical protein
VHRPTRLRRTHRPRHTARAGRLRLALIPDRSGPFPAQPAPGRAALLPGVRWCAGIGHYWIVDLDPPVSLTGYLLVAGNYEVMIEGAGVVEVRAPAPLRIDLDLLFRR